MRKAVGLVLCVCVVSFLAAGCSGSTPSQSASGTSANVTSKDVIDTAKIMKTPQEKVGYLMEQADIFYNSKQFQKAIDVAQYVLQYLDKDSQQAQSLLEKAKDALTAKAQEAVEKTAGGLKNKIGGLGQ